MLNRSNNDSLNALLLVQESLRPVIAGRASLNTALPDLLVSLLDAVGSQNGQLIITNTAPDAVTAVSLIDGHVELESDSVLPASLKEDVEDFVQRHKRELYVADTKPEDVWFFGSLPQTASSSWSAVSVPIRTENSAVGLLTVLKPGSDRFVQEDILLLSLFAGQIGTALTALQLKDAVQSGKHRSQELLLNNQDLATMLVHDLQGPLGNVLTSLEMVQEGLGHQDNSGLSLLIDIAVRSSKQLQALVSSLLDIGRLEAGQEITDRQVTTVSDLVDYVAEAEGPALEQRQVMLSRNLSPNLPLIHVNVNMMQRVLLNLIDNALKVSMQNQKILIRADVADADQIVKISVIDQGPGIPEAYRERIFEKYEQVNGMSTSKGLGLGLAFCKLAVESHGGRIWVEDYSDEGACFCFTIPVSDTPAPAS